MSLPGVDILSGPCTNLCHATEASRVPYYKKFRFKVEPMDSLLFTFIGLFLCSLLLCFPVSSLLLTQFGSTRLARRAGGAWKLVTKNSSIQRQVEKHSQSRSPPKWVSLGVKNSCLITSHQLLPKSSKLVIKRNDKNF